MHVPRLGYTSLLHTHTAFLTKKFELLRPGVGDDRELLLRIAITCYLPTFVFLIEVKTLFWESKISPTVLFKKQMNSVSASLIDKKH